MKTILSRLASRKALGTLWAVLLVVGAAILWTSEVEPLELGRQMGEFLVESAWAAPLFVLVFLVRTVFFFSTAVLSLLAGAVFGVSQGSFLVLAGSLLSALLAHRIGLMYPPETFAFTSRISDFLARRRTSHFKLVMILHLLHAPFDVVNFLAGSLHLNRRALLKSQLAAWPGFMTFIFLGASSGLSDGNLDFSPVSLIMAAFFFVAGIAVADKLEGKQ